jgi:hypothetical protein
MFKPGLRIHGRGVNRVFTYDEDGDFFLGSYHLDCYISGPVASVRELELSLELSILVYGD